jgi:hypothetical protein
MYTGERVYASNPDDQGAVFSLLSAARVNSAAGG